MSSEGDKAQSFVDKLVGDLWGIILTLVVTAIGTLLASNIFNITRPEYLALTSITVAALFIWILKSMHNWPRLGGFLATIAFVAGTAYFSSLWSQDDTNKIADYDFEDFGNWSIRQNVLMNNANETVSEGQIESSTQQHMSGKYTLKASIEVVFDENGVAPIFLTWHTGQTFRAEEITGFIYGVGNDGYRIEFLQVCPLAAAGGTDCGNETIPYVPGQWSNFHVDLSDRHIEVDQSDRQITLNNADLSQFYIQGRVRRTEGRTEEKTVVTLYLDDVEITD